MRFLNLITVILLGDVNVELAITFNARLSLENSQ